MMVLEQLDSNLTQKEGLYLFCLAQPQALAAQEEFGLDEQEPLFCWSFQDCVCVLSKVSLAQWTGPEAEKRLQDLAWLGPRACRHEQIIEQIMAYSPVFPARFGTIFSSWEPLQRWLPRYYSTISSFLTYITDKQEWSLKGLLDLPTAEETLLVADPRYAALPTSSGARYLLEKRLRADIRQKVRDWTNEVTDEITRLLQPDIAEIRFLKPQPRELSGRDEEMIFNWALLVSKHHQEAFHHQLHQLQACYDTRGLKLELSGPWPPYNFCPALAGDSDGSL